ncbi:peroxide stress protein YaaA [Hyphobacterium sp.]|uniref:peroxide stress protein YaaA n=1 Tax=Hyphobacterium sp. TaxID=2004662 RepID=UPI003BAC78E5
MLVLLSPAKLMNFEDQPSPETTQPELLARAATLSKTTRNLTRSKIQQMMGLSDDLAQLNYERFRAFDPENKSGKAAVLTFNGEVYRGLGASDLDKDDLTWAQDRLRILSGLYGVLRPLDQIQPYRLEMGTKLHTRKGETLYDYWGSDIAKALNASLDAAGTDTILNLSSNEYFKVVDKKALKANVIDVSFKEEKDGKSRPLFMFTKVARGLMARWVIENRVTDPAQLSDFNIDGYRFDAEASTDNKLEFARPQPAPKNAKKAA